MENSITVRLMPQIYPFLSTKDKYAEFISFYKFLNIKHCYLFNEEENTMVELNASDFVLSKGFLGTDNIWPQYSQYKLYYKTECPIAISYEIGHPITSSSSFYDFHDIYRKRMQELYKNE